MGTLIFHMRQFESHFSSEHCVAAFTEVWFYFSSLMRTFLIKICTWRPTGMGWGTGYPILHRNI